jgi:hypothetical protein
VEEEVVFVVMEGSERFEDAENVELYREASDAKNTKKSTDTWVRAFNEWRETNGILEELHQTEAVVLNTRLKLFFGQLRKKNGDQYEPACLKVMMAALDRELRNQGCPFSLCFNMSCSFLSPRN